MNNTKEDLCLVAQDTLTPTFKAIITTQIVVGCMAIIPNALLVSAVWKVTVFPSNLRLLLGHLSCILLYFSVVSIGKGVYVLTTSPCSFSISVQQCKLIELTTVGIALPNMFYTLIGLCIERLYATVTYRKYDKDQVPWMGICLIICAWITAFLVSNGHTIHTLPDNEHVPFCDNTFLPPGSSYIVPTYVTLEIAATLVTLLLHYYNRNIAANMAINRAMYDLSSRFLVNQNVQVNAILLPSMILHVLCHLPNYLILLPVKLTGYWAIPMATKAWVIQSSFLLRLVYAFVDPVIAFWYNGHLRRYLRNGPIGAVLRKAGLMGLGKPKNEVAAYSPAVAHFEQLEIVWATKVAMKIPRKATV